MFSIPLLIFLFWSKGWAFEGNSDNISVVFILCWRHSWIVLASVAVPLLKEMGIQPLSCQQTIVLAQLQMKKNRRRKEDLTWKDNQPRNPETRRPRGRVKAAAKSLLNFLNQTSVSIGHALQMLGKKSEPVNRVWDTSYYFPDHQGAISQVDFLKGTWASVFCMKIIISVMMNNLTTIPNCHPRTTHGFQQKEIPCFVT